MIVSSIRYNEAPMKKEIKIKASRVIASTVSKAEIAAIASSLQGKEFFSAKIALAKRSLSDLKSLPI